MIKILDNSSTQWNDYINKMPEFTRDIYFTKEYCALSLDDNSKNIKLFIYQKEENLALYPFLITNVFSYNSKFYYDIETPYGYGGPISNTDNKLFLKEFEDEFSLYCMSNNIIAEFIRFHPLISNQDIFKENIIIEKNRLTTFINLNRPIDEIWKTDISSKNRNVIRKALNSGLKVSIDKNISKFKDIYFLTMKRLNANKDYYFSDEYFEKLSKLDIVCISIQKDDLTIASAIFLKHKNFFHYHLSGSLSKYLKYAPNNLLLWSAIKYANEHGFSKFHFGGGLSSDTRDKLFKFKKSFCSNTADFYIGKRIHNKKIYDLLIDTWEKKNQKKKNLFLQYKL